MRPSVQFGSYGYLFESEAQTVCRSDCTIYCSSEKRCAINSRVSSPCEPMSIEANLSPSPRKLTSSLQRWQKFILTNVLLNRSGTHDRTVVGGVRSVSSHHITSVLKARRALCHAWPPQPCDRCVHTFFSMLLTGWTLSCIYNIRKDALWHILR